MGEGFQIGSLTAVGSTKISQTEEQMSFLANNVQDLSLILDELETKLSPILRSDVEKVGTSGSTPEVSLIPLADSIRNYARNISMLSSKVRNIKSRIEL